MTEPRQIRRRIPLKEKVTEQRQIRRRIPLSTTYFQTGIVSPCISKCLHCILILFTVYNHCRVNLKPISRLLDFGKGKVMVDDQEIKKKFVITSQANTYPNKCGLRYRNITNSNLINTIVSNLRNIIVE